MVYEGYDIEVVRRPDDPNDPRLNGSAYLPSADKIEAAFKKGVLTVTLPKKPEAQKPAKKIEVKAA